MDRSGAVVPGVQVLITKHPNTNGDIPLNAEPVVVTTNDEGRFSVANLEPGVYTIVARVPGFGVASIENYDANVGGASSVTLTIGEGVEPPAGGNTTSSTATNRGCSRVSSGRQEFDALTWNVWEEKYSSDPSFRRTKKLLLGERYSLIVDLSGLKYDSETGSFSRPTSPSFTKEIDKWIKSNDAQATVDVLAIPDERFFQPQSDNERVKRFDINLGRFEQPDNKVLSWRDLLSIISKLTRMRPFRLVGSHFEFKQKSKSEAER